MYKNLHQGDLLSEGNVLSKSPSALALCTILARARWTPRVKTHDPKECPNCKHRFSADWGLKLKCDVVTVKSKEELLKLREDIAKWNEKLRWTAE